MTKTEPHPKKVIVGEKTLGKLIGEFKGKNIGWRVLPDGKTEVTAQGTGKILDKDAYVLSTSTGKMENGIFTGTTTSIFTTMEGETIASKGIAIGYPSGNGGATRAASMHTT